MCSFSSCEDWESEIDQAEKEVLKLSGIHAFSKDEATETEGLDSYYFDRRFIYIKTRMYEHEEEYEKITERKKSKCRNPFQACYEKKYIKVKSDEQKELDDEL